MADMGNDILDSVGGSLLNDLLSDLNAAVDANRDHSDDNDRGDDLFALLEQELASTYADPAPLPSAPPGLQQQSPAAFVVNQQANNAPAGSNDDAWSAALSQFGGMSLAADFLAADTAKKQVQGEVRNPTQPEVLLAEVPSKPLDNLFKEDEDYLLDEEVILQGQDTVKAGAIDKLGLGGVVKTLGEKNFEVEKIPEVDPTPTKLSSSPVNVVQPNFESPHPNPMPPPPPPNYSTIPPHPTPVNLTLMTPQTQRGPVTPFPPGMGGPPIGENLNLNAGSAPNEEGKEGPPGPGAAPAEARIYFNNSHPDAPPIAAPRIASKFMPSRDVSYIVHLMLRPLQSLDTYNDDYYHWSVVNRDSQRMSMAHMGGGPRSYVAQPNPVWKGDKSIARAHEEKIHENVKTRAKTFAEEKKSLGQLVRTNVNRPKALLNTPALNKEEGSQEEQVGADSKYESEQRRSRIHLWKARMSIDKGYSAFLALIELRRLIQAHVGAPNLITELMVDVKTNVDRMHSSLGVTVKVESNGKKDIGVDASRLASSLSLSKGRLLCARVIEDGILPHPSACHILPIGLCCIFSWPTPAVEGEDRLLHAFTVLVQTPQPSIGPSILYRSLDMLISDVGEQKVDLSSVTNSHMRMKLLFAILSVGKAVCAKTLMREWSEKEKILLELLQEVQGK